MHAHKQSSHFLSRLFYTELQGAWSLSQRTRGTRGSQSVPTAEPKGDPKARQEHANSAEISNPKGVRQTF